MRRPWIVLLLAAAVLVARGPALFAEGVAIGDPAPGFKNLIGTDDKHHALSDFKDAKLVVLVFICNHCPVANAYEERLIALQKDYKDQSVQVVAVNVNNIEEDRLDPMKERAETKKYNFPYLYDPSQEIGHAYGATVTPHVFLLDQDRKVAYMGAIDDKQNQDEVAKHYLRDAIDALLDGKQPPKPVTKQFGCAIRYEDK